MSQQPDLSELQAHAESRGLSPNDAALFIHLVLQQALQLGNNGGGPVTREQLAEAVIRQASDEVLEEEISISEYNNDAFKRAMIQIMQLHAPTQNPLHAMAMPWDPLFGQPDPEELVEVEEDTDDGRRKRFKFTDGGLENYFGGDDPYDLASGLNTLSLKHGSHDIITGLCQHVELAVKLGKHLRPRDIVNLFIASRAFNHAVTGHLLSCIRMWISYSAPEAGRMFPFNIYRRLLVADPVGRTWRDQYGTAKTTLEPYRLREVRVIPGLRYMQLVLGRDRYCKEIIAILARNGHRVPPTMYRTLLRLWLLLELPTTVQRQAWLKKKETWSDDDLYNSQLFFIKLGMHFNDPIYGPGSYDLLHVIMGQKGLFPLWQLLMRKKWTKLGEVMDLYVRYNMDPPDDWDEDVVTTGIYGVPYEEIGRVHFEGWGVGERHLMRPDELVPIEAVARGLQLEKHLRFMVTWGYFDFATGRNDVPTEDEMYISDDENVLAHMDTTHHWKRKHALKARWNDLTEVQRQELMEEDEDERLRAMAWCGVDDEESDDENDGDWRVEKPYHPEDEVKRGYMMPEARNIPAGQPGGVPELHDRESWVDFMKQVMIGAPAQLTEDQALRAQSSQIVAEERGAYDFDWLQWLRDDQERRRLEEEGESDSGSETESGSSGDFEDPADTARADIEGGFEEYDSEGSGSDEEDIDAEGDELEGLEGEEYAVMDNDGLVDYSGQVEGFGGEDYLAMDHGGMMNDCNEVQGFQGEEYLAVDHGGTMNYYGGEAGEFEAEEHAVTDQGGMVNHGNGAWENLYGNEGGYDSISTDHVALDHLLGLDTDPPVDEYNYYTDLMNRYSG